jgi:hypothetical protein
LVARREATVGVRRGIAAVAEVGLDFDQSNHQAFSAVESPNQPTTDEFASDDSAVACIEGQGKRLGEGHARSIGQRVSIWHPRRP